MLVGSEATGDFAAGEFGHPSVWVREQPDRREQRLGPHVEPVARPGGNGDEIIALARDEMNGVADVEAKEPRALDEEANLVLGVGVLVEKLVSDRGPIGMIGPHAHDVDRAVPAVSLQPFDVVSIRLYDVALSSVGVERLARPPTLETDANGGELALDAGAFRRVDAGAGRVRMLEDS
jgi:hypothetical protein